MSFDQIKVSLCDSWGNDRNVANAAWASSYDLEKVEAKDTHDVLRVVTQLVNNKHDTPKERIWLDFFITCPIFVERQLDKYRLTIQYQDYQVDLLSAPFGRDGITQNELSGRYRTIPDRPYSLPYDVIDILALSSEESDTLDVKKNDIRLSWDDMLQEQHEHYQDALKAMKKAEQAGIITNIQYKRAREVIRGLLGTAFLTDMRIVMNMNAFEHIVNQRLTSEAQMESRVVAYRMIKELQEKHICDVMLDSMIKANDWNKLMEQVELSLSCV